MILLRQGLAHFRRHVRHKASQISMNECTDERNAIMSQKVSDYMVWLDMEMTGLDPDKNKILEVACLITDASLKPVSNELEIVIHQPDEELNTMNSWCTNQHKRTGLITASRTSTITNSDAELLILSFLKNHIPKKACPLAGNSVYMDRLFLKNQMPLIDDYLHYRIIDVSSIKELIKRWNPELYKESPKKSFSHRALDDIKESISELEYYRKYMFK